MSKFSKNTPNGVGKIGVSENNSDAEIESIYSYRTHLIDCLFLEHNRLIVLFDRLTKGLEINNVNHYDNNYFELVFNFHEINKRMDSCVFQLRKMSIERVYRILDISATISVLRHDMDSLNYFGDISLKTSLSFYRLCEDISTTLLRIKKDPNFENLQY